MTKFYRFSVPKEEIPDLKGARSAGWEPVFKLCNENGSNAEVRRVKVTTGFAKVLKQAFWIGAPLVALAVAATVTVRKSMKRRKVQKFLEQNPELRKKQPGDLDF